MTVLHNFTFGGDGAHPQTGMAVDSHGIFYGTTQNGGDQNCDGGGPPGCGVLFKLKNNGSGWVLTPLHNFHDGAFPTGAGAPTIGPNGTIYGGTFLGGTHSGGLIYTATPPPSVPRSGVSFWNYNPIYEFTDGNDGGNPPRSSPLIFDATGNLYGVNGGGEFGQGVVFELTPSPSGWIESNIYEFTGGITGDEPKGVIFDDEGNLYGTASGGGGQGCYQNHDCGVVFKLTPSPSGWTETVLHVFQQGVEGGPPGPLMRDRAGNLFGLTISFGANGGGTVWELSPSNGGWVSTVLYAFPTDTVNDYGPYAPAMDANGNLVGISGWGGANNAGFLFELSPSAGGWTYTDLYDFPTGVGPNAGCDPQGAPLVDAQGNIYDAAESCGLFGGGTIWRYTP